MNPGRRCRWVCRRSCAGLCTGGQWLKHKLANAAAKNNAYFDSYESLLGFDNPRVRKAPRGARQCLTDVLSLVLRGENAVTVFRLRWCATTQRDIPIVADARRPICGSCQSRRRLVNSLPMKVSTAADLAEDHLRDATMTSLAMANPGPRRRLQNLRDSHARGAVGARSRSGAWLMRRDAQVSAGDGASRRDGKAAMSWPSFFPDEIQSEVFERGIAPSLRDGACLRSAQDLSGGVQRHRLPPTRCRAGSAESAAWALCAE
jgi:hypothetical protein